MNDDTHPIGGSAWEPAPEPDAPAAAVAAGPTSRGARWRARFTGSSTRRRGALAGAAVGLVVVSGLGSAATPARWSIDHVDRS